MSSDSGSPDILELSKLPGFESLPLSTPPPGVIPNFDNPESIAYQYYVAAAVCFTLIFFFAGIRFHIGYATNRGIHLFDYLYILGLCTGILYIALDVAIVAGGAYGVHIWDIQFGTLTAMELSLALVSEVLYRPTIWLVKTSLLLMFVEIFGTLRWLRYLAWFGIVTMGIFYMSTMIVLTVGCAPRTGSAQADYLAALVNPSCSMGSVTVTIIGSAGNIISDIFILILPMPAVWRLHLPTARKIGITVIFMTGIAACIASAFAIVYLHKVSNSTDTYWNSLPEITANTFEITFGLLIPCMPSIAQTFRKHGMPFLDKLENYKHRLLTRRTAAKSSSAYQGSENYVQLTDWSPRFPRPAAPSQDYHSSESAVAGPFAQVRLNAGTDMYQIHKTTEFDIRPSANA